MGLETEVFRKVPRLNRGVAVAICHRAFVEIRLGHCISEFRAQRAKSGLQI